MKNFFKGYLVLFFVFIGLEAFGKGLDIVLKDVFGDWYFEITILLIGTMLYLFKGEI